MERRRPIRHDCHACGQSASTADVLLGLAAWKVAALALLAVGEAFVLVRLVRGGRLAQPGEIA